MDVLADIVRSMRLSGGVVIDGQLRGDFCVRSQFTADRCAPFHPCPETIVGYHYVRSGDLTVQVEGLPAIALKAGEAAILSRNDPHLLARRAGLPPVSESDVSWVAGDGLYHLACGDGSETTEVWSGFLGTANNAHPLLDALPAVMKVGVGSAEEVASADIVGELAESFVVQAIREHMRSLPDREGGWLAGLRDPAVAKALAVIHDRYAEDLDIEGLVREAGVSRSVLGERFVELLGGPPMRYCARWRMRLAANMLREGRQNCAGIAYSVGFNSEAAFNRAFKREYGEPPATWRRMQEEADRQAVEQVSKERGLPPQQVRYCNASDGTRIAYSVIGEGPPLVKTANWLNHLEFDFESPLWRPWIAEMSSHSALLRYDERGNGLSDWDTPELGLDAFVDDLDSVVDHAGFDRFDLFGISQGAPVAIAYAVRHPERVRKIVLCGGYSAGWRARGDMREVERREAMVTLTELGWGADNPAYRQLFTNLYIPGATPRQVDWYNELQRRSASPANAAKLMRVLSMLDVRHLLREVKAPTIVFHATGDQAVPYSEGQLLAEAIPGARFVPLDSRNHVLLADEPAFRHFMDGLRAFLTGHE